MINGFDKLKVLQASHVFTKKIYELTSGFPRSEKYHLIDQLCRAASSVPANIVEGNSRQSKKEYRQFLYQAKGSLAETQYHLMLSKDLGFLSESTFKKLVAESDDIGKMISGLIRYLSD